MARMDSFGFVHPTMDEQPTIEGYVHIAECGQCRIDFPELGDFAVSIVNYLEGKK